MTYGLIVSLIGAALAAALAGIGSAMGVAIAGKAAAGVISEKPDLFGKTLVLQALPGTQGIYGFLVAVLVMTKVNLLTGSPAQLTATQGFSLFAACMPIALVGLVSAIYQGKIAASSIIMTGKKPEMSVRGMTMTALVETYAILALLVSVLMWNAIKI